MPSTIKAVQFEPFAGGEQIGWCSVELNYAPRGLILNKFSVFCRRYSGGISIGVPLVQGAYALSRFSGIAFETRDDLTAFLEEIKAALFANCPNIGRLS